MGKIYRHLGDERPMAARIPSMLSVTIMSQKVCPYR